MCESNEWIDGRVVRAFSMTVYMERSDGHAYVIHTSIRDFVCTQCLL